MENLNEGKKKKGGMAYEAALREIDAQSAVDSVDYITDEVRKIAGVKAFKILQKS